MISLPAGTHVWLASGVTDMRRGMYGLAALVETTLAANPYGGHVFVFRGRRGDLIKVLWSDGDGLCLLTKRLERGRFVWPQTVEGSVHLSSAQAIWSTRRSPLNCLCNLRALRQRRLQCRSRRHRQHSRTRPPSRGSRLYIPHKYNVASGAQCACCRLSCRG